MTEQTSPLAFSTRLLKSADKKTGQQIFAEKDTPTLGKYYTTLNFYDYQRENPFQAGSEANEQISNASIVLPLPIQLYDRTSSAYSQQNLGVIGDLVNAFGSTEQDLMSQEFATSSFLRAVGGTSQLIDNFLSSKFLSGKIFRQANVTSLPIDTSAITTTIEQAIGGIANPNPVVKFQGPQLRSFNYTWYLSPKSQAESVNLQKILRTLRKASLAGKSRSSASLLTIPKLVQMNFYPWDRGGESAQWGWTDDSLIRMKRCHISNVSVNFNPANVPAFFWDHNPVIVEVSIELLEVEYLFEEDWQINKDGSFGAEGVGRFIDSISEAFGLFQGIEDGVDSPTEEVAAEENTIFEDIFGIFKLKRPEAE